MRVEPFARTYTFSDIVIRSGVSTGSASLSPFF